jgi:hypothetical protein
MTTPQPTLAGFIQFLSNQLPTKPGQLPPTSPWPAIAFAQALAIVNPALRAVCIPSQDAAGVTLNSGGWTIYALAVYNLATDILVNLTPDQPGFRFFANLRKKFNINGFVSGVVGASGDESTSVSMIVQDAAKAFTLKDLQNLKTTWGRAYLGLAQSYGPTTAGMS